MELHSSVHPLKVPFLRYVVVPWAVKWWTPRRNGVTGWSGKFLGCGSTIHTRAAILAWMSNYPYLVLTPRWVLSSVLHVVMADGRMVRSCVQSKHERKLSTGREVMTIDNMYMEEHIQFTGDVDGFWNTSVRYENV